MLDGGVKEIMNNLYFVILSVVVVIYVFNIVRKKKFSIKESFWWVVSSLLMLILAIFPHSIDYIAKLVGVSYPPSLLFVFCIVFLLFMNFRDSRRIAELQVKVVELAQELAIVKEKVNRDGKER